MLNNVEQCGTTMNIVKTMFNCVEQHQTMVNNVKQCLKMFNNVEQCLPMPEC